MPILLVFAQTVRAEFCTCTEVVIKSSNMASMSPPASSDAPTPVKKPRGRPAGGGGGVSKKKNANNNNEGGDTSTPRSSTGGGGGGRGRKKRQSTVDSHGASTPAASGSGGPLSMNTPGGNSSHAPSPGIANIASILEDEAIRGNREGSQLSASTRRRGATGRGETATQMGDGDAEDDEDEDDEDDEDEGFIGEHAFDEQAKERAEAKEALR